MNFDTNDDLDTLNQTRVSFRELKPGFGAEIINSGPRNITTEEKHDLVRILHRHGALLVRNQDLNPNDRESFLSSFGGLEEHTLKENCVECHPLIYVP